MSQRHEKARREFLKLATSTLGAAGMSSIVAEMFIGSIFNKAMAATATGAGTPKSFYIHFTMPGGPPRWHFDQVQNPSGLANQFTAGGFGNYINGGAATATAAFKNYKFINAGKATTYLPPVWGFARKGVDNADLLNHMQMFRGLDMQINNHGLSNKRQLAPVIGGLSITGRMADNSPLPLSSVNGSVITKGVGVGNPAGEAYRSQRSSAPAPALFDLGSNPLQALMKPFRPNVASDLNDPTWQRAIAGGLSQLDEYNQSIGIRPTVMNEAYDKAIDLIESGKFEIHKKWAAAYAKYSLAVEEALSAVRMKQIFTEVVKGDGTAKFGIDNNGTNLVGADLREMFTASTKLHGFAEAFALSEILATESITSSIVMPLGTIRGMQLGGKTFATTHDQHNVGSVPSTLVMTAFYRAMINCLHELVNELKAKDIFDDTVIHIGSEFSRSPRANGTGSDHGYYGASSTIISGKIKNYGLIGNIFKDGARSATDVYEGTWGRAAKYGGAPNRAIWVQDIANTICSMLGVQPVSENGVILLDASKNWAPFKKEANNV